MANELTIGCSLRFEKGSKKASFARAGLKATVAGVDYIQKTQNIGTSAELIDIGDIGTCGWSVWVNNDATNYVTIRNGSSGADLAKLLPGEVASFRLATNTPYAIANTASCDIEYLIVEA